MHQQQSKKLKILEAQNNFHMIFTLCLFRKSIQYKKTVIVNLCKNIFTCTSAWDQLVHDWHSRYNNNGISILHWHWLHVTNLHAVSSLYMAV